MAALETECNSRRVNLIWLEVREDNRAAQGFYRGLGFCEAGRRRGYYRDTGEDAVLMAKGDWEVG